MMMMRLLLLVIVLIIPVFCSNQQKQNNVIAAVNIHLLENGKLSPEAMYDPNHFDNSDQVYYRLFEYFVYSNDEQDILDYVNHIKAIQAQRQLGKAIEGDTINTRKM